MRFWKHVLFLSLLWGVSFAYADPLPHLAIGQIVEHPALDTLRLSIKEGLEKQGLKEGETLILTYENAQGNPTTAVQISHKLVSLQPTVIVTLSTPMTQAVAAATTTIPIVFGAVTDPKEAKLTQHKNITGLTDFVPTENQVELMQQVIPTLQTIGVIYNSGEANSRKQVELLKELVHPKGLTVVEATVSKTSDVATAAKSLVGRVDAILLPTDNTTISALESILRIGTRYKIPVFGSDVDIVRRGAVAAYGVDWRQSGLELAQIIAPLLKGTTTPLPPIQHPNQLVLHLNSGAAQKMGVSLPQAVQQRAHKVF